jgi:uncharacterized protein YbgA (DUF1722 family)
MTEALAPNDKKWRHNYEKLVDFKRKNEHCLVPTNYEQDKALGRWVDSQRYMHAKDAMLQDRRELLDEIGFVWRVEGTGDKRWKQKYEELVEFKRKNGHCLVQGRYEQDKPLGTWVCTQRVGRNKIRQDRKELLDELGFVWEFGRAHNDKNWNQQYEKLVEFKRKNGHCILPRMYEQDKSLGSWVSTQRKLQKKNAMRQDHKELLDELGFVWRIKSAYENWWNQQYGKLVDFKRKNGHCIVQRDDEDKSLGQWVSQQRHFGNKNKLLQDRKELLDKLEFVWNMEDREWYLQYEKLVALKQQHGHCPVRFSSKDDSSLSCWIQYQRSLHKKNTMRQDRKELLNTLEFVWEVPPLVIRRSSTTDDVRGLDKALGQWNDTQRNVHTKHAMPQGRIDKIWEQQYEKLVDLKRKNGHCVLPRIYEQDKSLGQWVRQQRDLQNKKTLLQGRKELLDKLEFVWNVMDPGWYLQYEKLVALKQQHGHCPVRFRSKDDSSLRSWIQYQRSLHKKNTFRQDRKELLNALDFVWEVPPLVIRRSSTTDDVSGLIGLFHAWSRSLFSLSFYS